FITPFAGRCDQSHPTNAVRWNRTCAIEIRDAREGGRMDFLRAQAAKIREQLAGLSPSQRMLAGTLVVIMVMTLLWWSRYAGSSEMEELLPQDFSAEDIARITAMID